VWIPEDRAVAAGQSVDPAHTPSPAACPPEVLYAPGDFPEHVSVTAYVDGMRHGSVANAELLKSVVRDTLKDVIPTTLSQTITPQQVTKLVDQAIASAYEGIANRMLSVDLSAIHPDFRDFKTEFPLAEGATVADFLDRLWAMMRDHVRPFTYGTHWVLIDRKANTSSVILGADGREATSDSPTMTDP